MNPPRETVWAALFQLFAAKLPAAGFVVVERRLKHWNDVPAIQQPYFCQAQTGENIVQERGKPPVYLLRGDLYLYARTDGNLDPGPVINPLMDAVEAAIKPSGLEEVQTLGGLVHWCRIEGDVETDEGTLGPQSVAIIPIVICLGG